MTRYAAHPTMYKGILFRSRLEAKWAAYFDARGWPWVYEPFDLPGYIPDFGVITDRGLGTVLVEVKPATKLSETAKPIARILKAGWKGPWMVVGADPDICMEGRGKRGPKRRRLGTEAPNAWAHACNVTQWKPNQVHGDCPVCGKPKKFLHNLVCKP